MTALAAYKSISRRILLVIVAELFLQLIHTSYQTVFNFYMVGLGYSDATIAAILSYRSLPVILIALPFGYSIRHRRLLPVFKFAAIVVPSVSLVVIWAASQRMDWLISTGFSVMGAASACARIATVPYIMRNARKDLRVECMALSFLTLLVSKWGLILRVLSGLIKQAS